MARHPQCEELLDSSYTHRIISLITALDAIDQSGAPVSVQNAILKILVAWDAVATTAAQHAHNLRL